ncbi:signal peptidase I [Thermococcus sp. P6]|uniref:signal peptidase I n=1 Tax=Thermococcus sp. P6 TaxID=122420 RepID=UPI000B59CE64|nr:signal peptidase I [Thermococcus sp. P6]ASJ10392.1 signal peptidase I [Thermococcus sp. P6]
MKALAGYALMVIVGVLVVGSLVGMLLDRPVFISYAYSGSMSPTINRGDVFFINPFAGNPVVGDIIVFQTGSVWTVHRVYAETEGGYITKGDNNIATDQQSHGIPPVPGSRIAGTVITAGGRPVKIPLIGNYLGEGLSEGNRVLFAGALMILGILVFAGEGTPKARRKGKRYLTVKFRALYLLASVFLLLMVAVSTFASWEEIPVTYSVTSAGEMRDEWHLPGEEFQRKLTIENGNIYPMLYYISPGATITGVSEGEFRLGGGGEKGIILDIKAPLSTALYSPKLRVNAYPPLLPASLMGRLHGIHPMVPLMAILLEVSLFLAVLYWISGVGDENLLRIRKRRGSLLERASEVFGT